MKKIILPLVVFVFLFIPGFTQQFHGGLMAGIVGSQVAGDLYSGYNKVGFMGGGYVALQLDPKFSLQLEMEYIQKGSRHNADPDLPTDITYKLNLSYIEMPLLLRYRVMEHVDLEAGLALAAMVSHKETQDGQSMADYRPGFKSTNLSFVGGISYTYKEIYRVNLRTDNSLETLRKGTFPGMVRRIGTEYGQFHDILVISLFYRL
ncbi:MAG: porin family protein [Bacteroidales bacterium]